MVIEEQDINRCNSELVEALTRYLTPTIEEVADWHFTDSALYDDWNRPLVRVLRFFVGDNELFPDRRSDEPLRLVVTDALVDMRSAEEPPEAVGVDGSTVIAA